MTVSHNNASPSLSGRSAANPHHPDLTPLWVILGLAMGPAVALGLGRFAYALLLPSMRAELGWNFAQAGAMNTANAAGYLIGAIVAAPVGRRMGDKRVFAFSLVLAALTVGASGLTADFAALLLLRAAAGFTGAFAFVCGAGLTSAAAMGGSKHRAPTLLGVYFAGAGMGITASALAVPPCWGQLDGAAAGLSWARLRSAPPHSVACRCGARPNPLTFRRTRRVRAGRHGSWRARSWPMVSSAPATSPTQPCRQPRFGCVSLKLGKAWIFVHQSAKPGTLKTASLSGVSET